MIRILYGVQATGNGHISRARQMAPRLAARGARVTWLFSGRDRGSLEDMEVFGDFACRRGLSFVSTAGRVSRTATMRSVAPLRFLADLRALRLADYDLVVTDYEPLSAWAARLRGVRSVGIGHQYAFLHGIPKARDPLGSAVLAGFAPPARPLGLHWHHFDAPLFPPIIDANLERAACGEDFTLVYLPFEDRPTVLGLLRSLAPHRFVVYAPGSRPERHGNVDVRPTNVAGFRRALRRCARVICNAGFELVSECLHLGVPVLVRPLEGQVEQQSNARALETLKWGRVVSELRMAPLRAWLTATPPAVRVRYPDVAAALADWLCDGAREGELEPLRRRLWAGCRIDVPWPQPLAGGTWHTGTKSWWRSPCIGGRSGHSAVGQRVRSS